jgi:methionyl-tRNA synthetase
MSKSIGNVIAPKEILGKYGVDTYRYFFLRHISSSDDGDFTWDKLAKAYNGELANELGNAVSRVASMITRYQAGVIGDVPESKHDRREYDAAMEKCQFDIALSEVWEQVRGLNQFIDETKPWVIAKEQDPEHLQDVLAQAVSDLLQVAELLVPFMPDTASKIEHIFVKGVVRMPKENLFPRLEIG